MTVLFAIVSGHIGVRLRTHCRIRHNSPARAHSEIAKQFLHYATPAKSVCKQPCLARCNREIPGVQIFNLCDGYISLSYAEGFCNIISFCHFPYKVFPYYYLPGHDTLLLLALKNNTYHLKSLCIPTFSKYSCLAFSFYSAVGAVLYLVYNSLFVIASSLSSNPFFIFSENSSISSK